jgi:hypothetical protein
MQPAKINYKIYQGSTFQETFRWESETKVYVPIQSIAKAAPCVITTSEPHNLPTGWRFRVVGAGGMKEINSVGEDAYYISTGTVSELEQLEALWIEAEALWADIRDQDAQIIAPKTRPWAGLASYQAYTILMSYTPPAGTPPPPPNMAPALNNARTAYLNWQNDTSTTNTIQINQVNSLGYTAYTNGGVIEFNQPVPLIGLQARMQIRETVDSPTVIHEATTQNNQISIDTTTHTIQITLLANITQSFNFATAVYSLELYNGNNVIPFINGNITLVQEVTR